MYTYWIAVSKVFFFKHCTKTHWVKYLKQVAISLIHRNIPFSMPALWMQSSHQTPAEKDAYQQLLLLLYCDLGYRI